MELKKESEKTVDIKNNFLRLVKARDKTGKSIHVACYFETNPTYALDKGKKKMVHVGVIVEKESATLPPIEPIPISATHERMCKFAGDWVSGYEAVSGRLARLIKDMTTPSEPKTQSQGGVHVSGNVKYKNNKNYGGVMAGHIVGTTPRATKVVGAKGAVRIALSINRRTGLADISRHSIFMK